MRIRCSRWQIAFGVSVLTATVLWLTIAALSPGYIGDIYQYKLWTKWITEQGATNAYAEENLKILYPPVNLYLLAGIGNLYRTWVDPSFDWSMANASQLLTWLIKLPAVIFHLVTGAVVFVLVQRRHGERLAWVAGTALLFDPAALFDVAHWGQPDPVHALFGLLSVGALAANRNSWAGFAIGLAAITKPQSWILLPLIWVIALRNGGLLGLARSALGAMAAVIVGLTPFIAHGSLSQLMLLGEHMNSRAATNAISANAHNLWWLPTLASGRFIDDLETIVGPVPYRWVAVGLVGLMLLACIALVMRPRPADLFLVTALLCAGWFFFTPRAHENHSFFLLPFLAVAWPAQPRLFGLYLLASLALLANLALEDPLIVGQVSQAGLTGAARPSWFVVLTVLNVGMFAVLVAGLTKASGLFSRVWSCIPDFRKPDKRPAPLVRES
jgi:hypothetical protein